MYENVWYNLYEYGIQMSMCKRATYILQINDAS